MGIIVYKDNKNYYSTKTQLKIAGTIVEVRKYGRDFFVGDRPRSFRDKTEKTKNKYSDEEIQDRRYRRAKRKLHDSINSNAYAWTSISGKIAPPIFITFTFAKNMQDIEQANYEFTKFILRFNFFVNGDGKSYLKYIVVIEFQERGAIHFHALFFNLPFIHNIKTEVADLWGHGFVQVKAVKRIKNIALYMSKYMSKRFDDPRLRGKKCYFASKGLKKPILIYYDSLVNQILSFLPPDSIEFQKVGLPAGDYMISMDFTRYNLKEFPDALAEALAFLADSGYDGPAHNPPLEEINLPAF